MRRRKKATTIIIVDDHTIVREGVIALLQDEPGIEVVGQTSDSKTAVALVNRLNPDIVLLDLVLRDEHGVDVLRKVRQKAKVIILSMRSEELYVAESISCGAAGYLLKEATSAELVKAIRAVSEGGSYLSSGLNKEKINELLAGFRSQPDPYTRLTSRERTILPLAAEGQTSAEIGEKLGISARTVEVHRARMMRKLGLKSQTELVRYAARRKLVFL